MFIATVSHILTAFKYAVRVHVTAVSLSFLITLPGWVLVSLWSACLSCLPFALLSINIFLGFSALLWNYQGMSWLASANVLPCCCCAILGGELSNYDKLFAVNLWLLNVVCWDAKSKNIKAIIILSSLLISNTLSFLASLLWNELLFSIHSLTSVCSFKSVLKAHLFSASH